MDNAKSITAKGEKAILGAADSKETREFSSPSPPAPGTMATIEDDDERLLARIGYKQVRPVPANRSANTYALQELRREFQKWSIVSYAISILGVLGSVPATIGVPLTEGGPGTAVWAWMIGSVMAMCIASSGNLLRSWKDPADDGQLLSWCQRIRPLVGCISSRSRSCRPNTSPCGRGSLGGAISWARRLALRASRTRLRR